MSSHQDDSLPIAIIIVLIRYKSDILQEMHERIVRFVLVVSTGEVFELGDVIVAGLMLWW